jgi:hypothetical protein
VAHICNPSYLGGWDWGIVVPGQPGQTVYEPPSPKQPEQRGLEVWRRRESACFASAKPWVQTPVPLKQNKKTKTVLLVPVTPTSKHGTTASLKACRTENAMRPSCLSCDPVRTYPTTAHHAWVSPPALTSGQKGWRPAEWPRSGTQEGQPAARSAGAHELSSRASAIVLGFRRAPSLRFRELNACKKARLSQPSPESRPAQGLGGKRNAAAAAADSRSSSSLRAWQLPGGSRRRMVTTAPGTQQARFSRSPFRPGSAAFPWETLDSAVLQRGEKCGLRAACAPEGWHYTSQKA